MSIHFLSFFDFTKTVKIKSISLDDFPDEILIKIFKTVGFLFRLCQVSRRFHNICEDLRSKWDACLSIEDTWLKNDRLLRLNKYRRQSEGIDFGIFTWLFKDCVASKGLIFGWVRNDEECHFILMTQSGFTIFLQGRRYYENFPSFCSYCEESDTIYLHHHSIKITLKVMNNVTCHSSYDMPLIQQKNVQEIIFSNQSLFAKVNFEGRVSICDQKTKIGLVELKSSNLVYHSILGSCGENSLVLGGYRQSWWDKSLVCEIVVLNFHNLSLKMKDGRIQEQTLVLLPLNEIPELHDRFLHFRQHNEWYELVFKDPIWYAKRLYVPQFAFKPILTKDGLSWISAFQKSKLPYQSLSKNDLHALNQFDYFLAKLFYYLNLCGFSYQV